MSEYLNRVFDSYRRSVTEGRDLMERAASESRDLTAEETERLDALESDVTAKKAEIDRIQRFEELRKASDAFRADAAPMVEEARVQRREPTDSEMFRVVFRGHQQAYESHPSQAALAGNLDLRALQSVGGSAIPVSFADFIVVYERTATPMLDPAVVTILNRTSGNQLTIPRLTADPAHGGTVTAQAGGINELDSTISSINLTPFKYGVTNLWSAELAQDETIGLEDIVGRSTGRELGLDIGVHLTTGTGTTQPFGIVDRAANGGTATGTANSNPFVGPSDVVDLFYGRAAPYRQVGTWLTSNIGKVRKMQDANGQYLWQPSLIPGAPETLLGRPIFENPAMAAFASASKSILFGDTGRYFVSRVVPIRVESSIHYKFSTDQIALRTIERVDGDLVDTAAVAYLVSANA